MELTGLSTVLLNEEVKNTSTFNIPFKNLTYRVLANVQSYNLTVSFRITDTLQENGEIILKNCVGS